MTDDLVAFLRARLGEDERVAKAAAHHSEEWKLRTHEADNWFITAGDEVVVYDESSPSEAEAAHIARHDPARVLAEVAAKRRIIDWHRHVTFYREPIGPTCEVCGDHDGEDWCQTLRLLALPYAGHESYRAEWAP